MPFTNNWRRRERLLRDVLDFSEDERAIALVFAGENLPGMGIGNADAFVSVNGQRFHNGNFPHMNGVSTFVMFGDFQTCVAPGLDKNLQ